ncbi:hypothetical protein CONCODRAFT_20589, partial [Conidiobolus coronatus NRRL 28638]
METSTTTTTSILYQTLSFLIVGALWGLTNPFIKQGTQPLNNTNSSFITKCITLVTNWKFIVPLALNLCGSSVYYFMLGEAEISLSIPITNAITLCFTIIGDSILSKQNLINMRTGLGILLIVAGIS